MAPNFHICVSERPWINLLPRSGQLLFHTTIVLLVLLSEAMLVQPLLSPAKNLTGLHSAYHSSVHSKNPTNKRRTEPLVQSYYIPQR